MKAMATSCLAGKTCSLGNNVMYADFIPLLKLIAPGVSAALSAAADAGILKPIPCRHG
jgi:hypothetical protein